MSTEHTPGPWKLFPDKAQVRGKAGEFVADCDCRTSLAKSVDWQNAEFIVRACNSHNALLEACKAFVGYAQEARSVEERNGAVENVEWLDVLLNNAKTAIARRIVRCECQK